VTTLPYKIHTVLTDNGIQFGDSIQHRSGPTARCRLHMFDRICREHDIEHRFTKPNHPWTNGQVERMNRSLKEATVRRYHYDTHRQLEQHLAAFLDAYDFAKRLKTLRGLTPYEEEATVRRYHYDTHRQLEQHLAAFLDAYNFAKRLKTLRGLTPYEAICKAWADTPDRNNPGRAHCH
jgi:transposase InsO family protein